MFERVASKKRKPRPRNCHCTTVWIGRNRSFLATGLKLNTPRYRLEWQAYGKAHFSWRGRDGHRFKISRGSSGQTTARRLRYFSGLTGTQPAELQVIASRSED